MPEYVWGPRAVLEALRGGRDVKRLLVVPGDRHAPPIAEALALAADQGVPIGRLTADRLAAISPHHQGIAAEVATFAYAVLDDILAAVAGAERPALVLALDSLQDPQNLGALLRTAEAAGVDGVLLPEHRAAGVTATVARASAGAVEHLRIARVVNLPRALDRLKEAGLWVYGLAADGETPYFAADLAGPVAIVVGSEGEGLGRLVRTRCDIVLRLPLQGRVAALNAAVAGSIVLYEALRQRETARLPKA